MRVCLACLALQVALLTGLVLVADWRLLAAAPLALWVVSLWIVSRIPEGMYDQWRLRPTISDRATLLMIASYYTLLVVALAWITLLTGVWAAVYFFLLWVLPLLTSFPFFMLLRQFVQHANCDRGKFTNTRVFLIGWLFEFAIFPFGQKYHLPHHLFASVPHYRLKELHEILLGDSDYRDAAVIVHGYVLHKPGHPTVIDVLGDPPAAGGPGDPYLDDDVLSGNVVV